MSGSLGMIRLALSVRVAPLPCVVMVQEFRRSDSRFCCMYVKLVFDDVASPCNKATESSMSPVSPNRLAATITRRACVFIRNGRVHADVHDTVCEKALVGGKRDLRSASPELTHVFTDAFPRPTYTGKVAGGQKKPMR